MGNTDKYKVYQLYKSSDGINWSPRDEYKAVLLEEKSTDCGYSARTITTIDDDCSGTTKVITTTILNQESEDFGETWTTVSSSSTITYEYDSVDCGFIPQSYDYLTFIALSDGKFVWNGGIDVSEDSNTDNQIQYSLDGGNTWSEPNSKVTVNVKTGDIVKWKGEMTPNVVGGIGGFGGTALYDVEKNIMSLLYGDDFSNKTSLSGKDGAFKLLFGLNPHLVINANRLVMPATILSERCYEKMFQNCKNLKTAPQLPANTLDDYCYLGMFSGCTSLTQPPSVLPATTLTDGCYREMFAECKSLIQAPRIQATTLAYYCCGSMFNGCSSLIVAPELPATTMAEDCYFSMFRRCTSLITAPELSATTMAKSCYANMFSNCTSLTQIPSILPSTTLAIECYGAMFANCTSLTTAPQLPATTLADVCYSNMFNGCTSLTTAPTLPATTLANGCYFYMFTSCANLNYIKMLATDISANNCLLDWVQGVSASGTFVKAANATLPSGYSGIPSGWTVQNV